MRILRPRLWMLMSLVALAALVAAGVSWRRRTTIVAEGWEIYVRGGVPDPNDPDGGAKVRHLREYADGHVEFDPWVSGRRGP